MTTAFKRPGNPNWFELTADDENDEDKKRSIEKNRDQLSDALLSSLQMHNISVLAGSGCSIEATGPSMTDLWNSVVGDPPPEPVRNLFNRIGHEETDKDFEALLSKAESYLEINDDPEVQDFLKKSKSIVLELCSSFISSENLFSHRRFLHRLSRRRARDPRLKVFTTNYDLCFERAASEIGGVVMDGFSFMSPRRYDPQFFGYDIIRRARSGEESSGYLEGVFMLHKLHGSVNWERNTDGSIWEVDDPDPESACLIYPASGKYQQSYTQPYLENIAQFLYMVREPNTCVVVSGFGFNDDHLAEPLLAAIRSNPHLRVIVVDRDARKKCLEESNRYWHELSELSNTGEDIWMINSGFKEFSEMIPDLKALTPAESLANAVKGIAGN